MFVLTKVLFAHNEILSAVSTEFERKGVFGKNELLSKHMARGRMQPHRLHRLKAGPAYMH